MKNTYIIAVWDKYENEPFLNKIETEKTAKELKEVYAAQDFIYGTEIIDICDVKGIILERIIVE